MEQIRRCEWAGPEQIYIDYHDNEWGRPTHDEKKLFEMLILEGMQAGLAWITVLKKREDVCYKGQFRKAARIQHSGWSFVANESLSRTVMPGDTSSSDNLTCDIHNVRCIMLSTLA